MSNTKKGLTLTLVLLLLATGIFTCLHNKHAEHKIELAKHIESLSMQVKANTAAIANLKK